MQTFNYKLDGAVVEGAVTDGNSSVEIKQVSGPIEAAFLLLLGQIITIGLAIIFGLLSLHGKHIPNANYFMVFLSLALCLTLAIAIGTDWYSAYRTIYEFKTYKTSIFMVDIFFVAIYYILNSYVGFISHGSLLTKDWEHQITQILSTTPSDAAVYAAIAYFIFFLYWSLCYIWHVRYFNANDLMYFKNASAGELYKCFALGAAFSMLALSALALLFQDLRVQFILLGLFSLVYVFAEGIWIIANRR